MDRQAEQTFETALDQLEKIVQGLEGGNLPLEEAIKQFEQGIKLSKFCSEKLDETEKKVTILLQDQNGEVSEKSFISEK